jgi:hypothetical protein
MMAVGSPCPICQNTNCICGSFSINSNVPSTVIYTTQSNLLQINGKNNDCIFKIDMDGNVYFGKDQVKIDTENELALGFILVISDLTGISFSSGNKDEFISKMIQYYRERQLNKIL